MRQQHQLWTDGAAGHWEGTAGWRRHNLRRQVVTIFQWAALRSRHQHLVNYGQPEAGPPKPHADATLERAGPGSGWRCEELRRHHEVPYRRRILHALVLPRLAWLLSWASPTPLRRNDKLASGHEHVRPLN